MKQMERMIQIYIEDSHDDEGSMQLPRAICTDCLTDTESCWEAQKLLLALLHEGDRLINHTWDLATEKTTLLDAGLMEQVLELDSG